MDELHQITSKFYKSEVERVNKLRDNKEHIDNIWTHIKNTIDSLYSQGIRFYVFEMDCLNKTIHTGLLACCNVKNVVIKPEMRTEIESIIKAHSIFENIIWEA